MNIFMLSFPDFENMRGDIVAILFASRFRLFLASGHRIYPRVLPPKSTPICIRGHIHDCLLTGREI